MEWNLVDKNISELKVHAKNPRALSKEQFKHIKKSIEKFGLIDKPIITIDGIIIGGHQRINVLKTQNEKTVMCWQAKEHMTDKDVEELNIRLNKNTGEWDYEILANQWDAKDLIEWGFEPDELSISIDALQEEPEDTAEDTPKVPVTKIGDIYQLNGHKLMCGSSTSKAAIDSLLGNIKIDLLLTDPPYGVSYIEDYFNFFVDFLNIIPFAETNCCYIFMSSQELHNLRIAMDAAKIKWGDYLLWVKNNHVLGRKDYNAKHEFVVYGWKGKHKFYGPFRTTVLEYNKPLKNDLHPTMKPIELLSQLITDGSEKGMAVYDPFLGSGSTLLASESLGRTCFGMEIDPAYCDVIVTRWSKHMNKIGKDYKVKLNGIDKEWVSDET